MTSPAPRPAPVGPTLVEALVAESTTVVDLTLLERLYLDLAEV